MTRFAGTLVLALCLVRTSIADATTYYVANDGNDSTNGTSPSTPWATLHMVNSWVYQPGDTILLKRGSVWQGLLLPCAATRCSGTASAYIKIDSYDTGTVAHPAPRIDGAGSGQATITLLNQSYWEIRNLEVTNHGPAGFHYNGIMATCDSTDAVLQVCHHIYIGHNYVHDVNGIPNTEIDSGILVASNIHNARWDSQLGWVSNANRWDDVTIEWNTVQNVTDDGIVIAEDSSAQWDPLCPEGNTFDCAVSKPRSTNVAIRNNTINSIGCDGVLMVTTDGAVAEYNSLGNWGLASSYCSGIWSAGASNTVIQHNEVFGAQAGGDRTAFDLDWGNISTYIQYNYTHNNYGGMLLVWETNDPTPGSGSQNTYIDDPIVRFNVSLNDGLGNVVNICLGRWPVGLNSLDFANNTIYESPINYYTGAANRTSVFATCGDPIPDCTASTISGTAWVYNNIFDIEGQPVYPSFTSTGFGDNTFYEPNHGAACPPTDGGASRLDPRFVSSPPANPGDVRLKVGSPALASGMYTPYLGPVDYFGNPVSTTNPPNRGAYDGAGL